MLLVCLPCIPLVPISGNLDSSANIAHKPTCLVGTLQFLLKASTSVIIMGHIHMSQYMAIPVGYYPPPSHEYSLNPQHQECVCNQASPPHYLPSMDLMLGNHIINCLHTQVGVGRRCLPTAIHPRMGIYMLCIRLRLWLDQNHPPLKVNLCTNFTCHCHSTVHPLPRLHTPQHLLWKLSSIS